MSGQKFTLLKFPHSTDEIISERISGLEKLIEESNDETHICALLQMIISLVTRNYEGVYIDQMVAKLIESHHWWLECYSPDASLSVEESADSED